MLGLTLWRPWPWAMINAPAEMRKGLENRDWRPSPKMLREGDRFALHAGKTFDKDGSQSILEALGLAVEPVGYRAEGVIGTVIYRGVLDDRKPEDVDRAEAMGQEDWFFGRFGWICDEPIALVEPVRCKGAMGLFTLPPEVEARVRAQGGCP